MTSSEMNKKKKNLINISLQKYFSRPLFFGLVGFGGNKVNFNFSPIHWDQNENNPQFSGDNLITCDGFSRVLINLAEGLDIKLETQV
jgi:hypothetical protein